MKSLPLTTGGKYIRRRGDPPATRASIYLYLEDADPAYWRALELSNLSP